MNFRGGANTASAAGKHCADAAELHLSGIGLVNEAVDWVLVINDVVDGRPQSLVALAPFLSVSMIKMGGGIALKDAAGNVLSRIPSAQALEDMQALWYQQAGTRLHAAGVVFREHEYGEYLRNALTGHGGPLTLEDLKGRGALSAAMEKRVPRPGSNYHAHHDLPFKFQPQFARIGIDVNDPAFGRWALISDHQRWHHHTQPKFNDFWIAWLNQLGGRMPTQQEFLDKLAEARSIYTLSQ